MPNDEILQFATTKEAAEGDAKAQFDLSFMYLEGRGTPKNAKKAKSWLMRAAKQGYPDAQCNYGVFWEERGANNEAIAWYKKSAAQGNTSAKMRLVPMLAARKKRVDKLKNAAKQGDAKAQDALGDLYEDGKSVPQDYKEAVVWYKKSAAQGCRRGMFSLGRMYEHGKGVPKSLEKSEEWFEKGRNQGT